MPQGIFTWVGQWLGSPLSTNVYYKNDVVKYNNIVYICVAAVSVPVGTIYWTFKKNGTTVFGPIISNTTAFMGGMSATTSDVLSMIVSDTPTP